MGAKHESMPYGISADADPQSGDLNKAEGKS